MGRPPESSVSEFFLVLGSGTRFLRALHGYLGFRQAPALRLGLGSPGARSGRFHISCGKGVAEDSATSLASQMRFSESHQGRDSFPPLLSFVSATEKCPLLAILHFLLLFCVFFKNVTEGPSGQRDRDKRTTQTPSFLKTFAPNLKPAHPRVRENGEGSGIWNLELSQPLLWWQSRVGRVSVPSRKLGAHLQPGTGCLHILNPSYCDIHVRNN